MKCYLTPQFLEKALTEFYESISGNGNVEIDLPFALSISIYSYQLT